MRRAPYLPNQSLSGSLVRYYFASTKVNYHTSIQISIGLKLTFFHFCLKCLRCGKPTETLIYTGNLRRMVSITSFLKLIGSDRGGHLRMSKG